jgi:hypothetical protein
VSDELVVEYRTVVIADIPAQFLSSIDYNTWEGQRAVAETVANSEHGSIQTPGSQSSHAEPWPGKP